MNQHGAYTRKIAENLIKKLEEDPGRYKQSKVRIIPCPIDDLVRRIERLIRLEVGKWVKYNKASKERGGKFSLVFHVIELYQRKLKNKRLFFPYTH